MDSLDTYWIKCLQMLLFASTCLGQTPSLDITPENKAVHVGETVTFECMVSQAAVLTTFISWEECITNNDGTCRRISNDDAIVYSALGGELTREARYNIHNPATAQYNLVLTGSQPEDAGTYRCISLNDANQLAYAALILLDSQPDCSHNLTEYTGTPLTTPLVVHANCRIGYYGAVAPVTTFQVKESDGSLMREILGNNMSTTGLSNYSINYQLVHGDHGKYFSGKTHFNVVPPGDSNMAQNIPSYSVDSEFGQLTGTGCSLSSSTLIISTVAIILQLLAT